MQSKQDPRLLDRCRLLEIKFEGKNSIAALMEEKTFRKWESKTLNISVHDLHEVKGFCQNYFLESSKLKSIMLILWNLRFNWDRLVVSLVITCWLYGGFVLGLLEVDKFCSNCWPWT